MERKSVVDIIIPVYRPDEKLEKLIEKLNQQTVEPKHIFFMQTIVEDEAEDTRVKKLLQKTDKGCIVPIGKLEFDHGGTRNRGAQMSQEPYMLFMTQDAVPEDEFLIETLIRSIEQKDTIAAAYGRQLPDDKVGVIETYTRQFNYPKESIIKGKEDLPRLGIKTYFCSNVCAMYRRDIYIKMGGFVTKTIFNEDMIMAANMVQAGYDIAYAADAKVVHAHKYTYWQQLTRNFDMAVSQRQYREIFEGVKSESEGIRLVKQTASYLLRQGKWYLIPDLIMQSGFKFMGYKLGLRYEKLPMWFIRKVTMNPRFWKEKEEK
ncbi:MAG: glycosyltransferase family 2 protein [Eubacterium sp.]